ncbi:[protein-PII] uridylyltransferase [Yunchengibacter salinarum]|uniref:[protein-PII] uridylyltransferase n=1 Tax=Yunchengibacter salinarum TaxID=3133399 RepID=UPI0035B61DE4
MPLAQIKDRKAIIDRKALMGRVAELAETHRDTALNQAMVALLKEAHASGMAEIRQRFEAGTMGGRRTARAIAYLTDQILRVAFDVVTEHLHPLANPTASERMALVAVGGYGRGEMAPYSDVDLLFLIPHKSTPWVEMVVETMLYLLWDLGLKVGYATRTPEECTRLARTDLTIRTALLESRYLWGDRSLFDQAAKRFIRRVVALTGTEFVDQKLAERDARHARMGDSRYVVEPNIKDGKGGLRDLQTMWWIARYLYGGIQPSEVLDQGVLTTEEYNQFQRAAKFLWTVRIALHFEAGRAEERLTFPMQLELAKTLGYTDHPGASGVERFMKHYFLVAKQVGDLTRVFCAVLEARQKKTLLSRLRRRRKVQGFAVEGERLTVFSPDDFKDNPARMIAIFRVADEKDLDIHPDALRAIQQNLGRITDRVRRDPQANRDFLTVLTSAKNGEINLRRMNEAGVLGRFIPDFGRVVAQMQYDMYHHYTVDEHTIRAIGLLARIERGELVNDHPLSSRVISKIASRRVLYMAVLLHDIAKGRGGDHSVIGAEVAKDLCPRVGLDPAETETVAWLVRWHLAMSNTAFKRDLSDRKTIQDFCKLVKSPERLRLLLVLTVVDIRAVGPDVWNGWKGQLLRDLYDAAEEELLVGHANVGRTERVAAKQAEMADELADWTPDEIARHTARFLDSYWIAEDVPTLVHNAQLIREAEKSGVEVQVSERIEPSMDMTQISVYAADAPGVFARISGALDLAGASITGARIHTTRDGMVMDNFIVQAFDNTALDDSHQLRKLDDAVAKALKGKLSPREKLIARNQGGLADKEDAFEVEPQVIVDNKASNWSTVIEVDAKDRPGLLYDLAFVIYKLRLSLTSAQVATFGERAVDVFYVRDRDGAKVTHPVRIRNLRTKLLKAVAGEPVFSRRRKVRDALDQAAQ